MDPSKSNDIDLILKLADSLSDGMIAINGDGQVISVNDPACAITGYAKVELIGHSFRELFPPQSARTARTHPLQKVLTNRQSCSYQAKPRSREIQLKIVPASGAGKIPAITVRAIAIIRSSAPRQTDEDPRAARVQMIGLFATGVAHDVNNDLTAIMCSVQLSQDVLRRMHERLDDGDPNKGELAGALGYLADTERITKRTATLTKQLLAYARQQPAEKQSVNLNESIKDTLNLVGKLIDEKIEVVTSLGNRLPPVLAERSQIDRILTNLILNARDAMPEGGTIKIETSWRYLDETFKEERAPWGKTGRYVLLSITDSGKGMDERTRLRIYEEFFTTKAKGTGLGLHTVYQIVKDNLGMIDVDSQPGEGTRFDIYLKPSDKGERKPQRKEGEGHEAAVSDEPSQFLILIAEDRNEVLTLMNQIISQAGYRVIVAGDGQQAVEYYRAGQESGEHISLSILDIGLPVMDGVTAKDAIHKINPDAMVILTSSTDPLSGNEDPSKIRDYEFLRKPFDGSQLLRAIETALEKKISAEQLTAS